MTIRQRSGHQRALCAVTLNLHGYGLQRSQDVQPLHEECEQIQRLKQACCDGNTRPEAVKYQMMKLDGRTDVKEWALSGEQSCMSTCHTHEKILQVQMEPQRVAPAVQP